MFVGRYGTFLTTRKNVPFPLNRRFCLRLKELVVHTHSKYMGMKEMIELKTILDGTGRK